MKKVFFLFLSLIFFLYCSNQEKAARKNDTKIVTKSETKTQSSESKTGVKSETKDVSVKKEQNTTEKSKVKEPEKNYLSHQVKITFNDSFLPEKINFYTYSLKNLTIVKSCVSIEPKIDFSLKKSGSYDYVVKFTRPVEPGKRVYIKVFCGVDPNGVLYYFNENTAYLSPKPFMVKKFSFRKKKDKVRLFFKFSYPLKVASPLITDASGKSIEIRQYNKKGATLTITIPDTAEDTYYFVLKSGTKFGKGFELKKDFKYSFILSYEIRIKNVKGFSSDKDKGGISFELADAYDHPLTFPAKDLKKFIKISPDVRFNVTFDQTSNSWKLMGNFKKGKSYTIIFQKGLKSKEGYVLKSDEKFFVNIPAGMPLLRFQTRGVYIVPRRKMLVPVRVNNIKTLFVTVYHVPRLTIANFLNQKCSNSNYYDDCYDDEDCFEFYQNSSHFSCSVSYLYDYAEIVRLREKVKVDRLAQKTGIFFLDLKKFVPLDEKGLFIVKIKNYDDSLYWNDLMNFFSKEYNIKDETNFEVETYEKSDYALINVTNIAIVTKVFDNNRIFVTAISPKSLSFEEGVRVSLYSKVGVLLGECVTDINGQCVVSYEKKYKRTPTYLYAEKGDDFTFVALDATELKVPQKFYMGINPLDKTQKVLGSLVLDRNIIRPGSNVRFFAFLRSIKNYSAVKMPVKAEIINPVGKKQFELSGVTDKAGIKYFVLKTKPQFKTGKYVINLFAGPNLVASKSFFLEEFVPERMKVKVKSAGKLEFGKPVKFEVSARYLSGASAGGSKFKALCVYKETDFHYKEDTSFTFKPERGEQKEKMNESVETEGVLNEKGTALFECPQPLWDSYKKVIKVKVYVDVFEASSGRSTRGFVSSSIYRYPYYIGLKESGSTYNFKRIKGVVVYPDGKAVTGNRVFYYSVYGVAYNFVSYFDDYGYEKWKTVSIKSPIKLSKKVSVKDGKFLIEFTPQGNFYKFIVKVWDEKTGQNTVYQFYRWDYYDAGNNDFKAAPPDTLDIKTDKKSYDSGDTITASTIVPFKGKLVWFAETDDIIKTEWKEATADGQKIDFSFQAPDKTSTVYVSALLVKKEKNALIQRAFGIKKVKIYPEKHRLSLKISMPQSVKPSSELVIKLKGNEPFEGVVYVVDEGILQLTRFKTPDLYKQTFKDIKLLSTLHETFGLFRKLKSLTGGGEEEQPEESEPEKTTFSKFVALSSGLVKSDSNGNLVVNFKIPQFYGKLRVMIHAANKTKCISYEKFVTVKEDLIVMPTIPRFSHANDTFLFPIFVSNTKKSEVSVEGKVAVKGGKVLSRQTFTAQIKGDSSTVVYVKVKTDKFAESMEISIHLKGGNTVYNDSFKIPVYPDKPLVVETKKFVAEEKNYKINEFIKGFIKKQHRVEVVVSYFGGMKSLKNLRHLIKYPYGCIEQTSSSLLPLLKIKFLLPLIFDEFSDKATVLNMINMGISRIFSMQTASGGFAYWPSESEATPWASVYATFVLLIAKEEGYFVPKDKLNHALYYVQKRVEDMPFKMFVLARAKMLKDNEFKDYLSKTEPKNMAKEDLLFLSAALKLYGYDKKAENFFKLAKEKNFSSLRDYSTNYYSPLRGIAVYALVSELLYPNSNETKEAVNRLIDKVGKYQTGAYYTTQELAFATLVIGNYIKMLKMQGDADAEIKGAKSKKTNSFLGKRFVIYEPDPGKEITVHIKKGEKPYIYIINKGFKEGKEYQPVTKGISVDRKIFDISGKPKETFKVGQTVVVRLSVQIADSSKYFEIQNMYLEDNLPMGFEIINTRNQNLGSMFKWIDSKKMISPDYVDYRDNKIVAFFTLHGREVKEFYYLAKVVTGGDHFYPPLKAGCMYDPEIFATSAQSRIEVKTGE